MANLPAAALRWPMTVSSSGNFELCSDIQEAWGLRVRTLLTTRFAERAMRSDYGCGLLDSLFDQVEGTSPEDEVRRAMSKWLPRLDVQKVNVTTDESEVNVTVIYRTPDGSIEEMTQAYRMGIES